MSTKMIVGPGATVIGRRGERLPEGSEVILSDERTSKLATLSQLRMKGSAMAKRVRVANGTVYWDDGKEHPAGSEVMLDDDTADRLVGIGSMVLVRPETKPRDK